MKKTRDELFLLKLHEVALKFGDFEQEVDKYMVGKQIGQNEKGVDNIVRHLAQANFVKKGDDNSVYLTENGLKLVEQLKESL